MDIFENQHDNTGKWRASDFIIGVPDEINKNILKIGNI
ncbi:Uncharacterized protein dnm_073890 [Desulfonema magnum]|uniref:Uncharacterized protein n=1 Tax=Desulfonema magnum TaxID=45655 RepID=A0A975BTE3_9BACT|nr:Uncharacterized protein dnm_073890 [Desulfonema magnum]